MGFGGGGSGSFVLPNHDHTNVLADGGELDADVSLIHDGINAVTFDAWIAAKFASLGGKLEKLAEEILSGTSTTLTMTPSTAVNFADYSKVFIEYIVDNASANWAPVLTINGIGGTAYMSAGTYYQATSTLISYSSNWTSSYWLLPTATFNGANRHVGGTIGIIKDESNSPFEIQSDFTIARSGYGGWAKGGTGSTNATTLTEAVLTTAVGTFLAESKAVMYGEKI